MDDREEHPWWMGLLETMGLPIAIGFLPGVLKKLGLDADQRRNVVG